MILFLPKSTINLKFFIKLFYGNLVYKFETIVGTNSFSAQLIKMCSYYKKIDYGINVLRQGQTNHGC